MGRFCTAKDSAGRGGADRARRGRSDRRRDAAGTFVRDRQLGQNRLRRDLRRLSWRERRGKQGFGPPLVHKIYEPSHHGDAAFQVAAAQGVRAHHWRFGNMPPQDGVTAGDVTAIIAYVRELQRANGIE